VNDLKDLSPRQSVIQNDKTAILKQAPGTDLNFNFFMQFLL